MISYKYKLYQSKKTTALAYMMREAAFVWNHALELQRRYYSLAKTFGWSKTYISLYEMQRHQARRIRRKRLDAQTVQELLERLDTAYKKFFRHENRRPPKFRSAGPKTSPRSSSNRQASSSTVTSSSSTKYPSASASPSHETGKGRSRTSGSSAHAETGSSSSSRTRTPNPAERHTRVHPQASTSD